MNRTLFTIWTAYAIAWAVAIISGRWELMAIAAFAFPQNVAFTFVSRGRNSGSLTYHFIASIFSNGIWLLNQIFSVALISKEFSVNGGASVTILSLYGVVYCLSTIPGSLFAHWLAKKIEKGKARNVQEDVMNKRLRQLELRLPFMKDETLCIPDPEDPTFWHEVVDVDQFEALSTAVGDLQQSELEDGVRRDDHPRDTFHQGGKL